ncbi:hypothetical protein ACNKHO_16470 [Shigella flexneri]
MTNWCGEFSSQEARRCLVKPGAKLPYPGRHDYRLYAYGGYRRNQKQLRETPALRAISPQIQ